MNNLTFGRYVPYDTCVHRLDPRNKIFLMILFLVSIFFRVSTWSTALILTGFQFGILLMILFLSHVSLKQLIKSLSALWILILFLMIIYIFIPNPAYNPIHIAFHIGSYPVNYDAFVQAGSIIFRLIMMIMLTMILTSTTKPMDLTYAIEWYLTPLKVVKFPSHIVAMTLSIALRFIPTLLDETQRIMKAQSSRGVDFNHGGLIRRVRALISLVIPLFVSAISRSEELSNAMEARGYDPYGKRSRYRILRFHFSDIVAFLFVGGVFGAMLAFLILDKNYMKVDFIFWIFHANPLF